MHMIASQPCYYYHGYGDPDMDKTANSAWRQRNGALTLGLGQADQPSAPQLSPMKPFIDSVTYAPHIEVFLEHLNLDRSTPLDVPDGA